MKVPEWLARPFRGGFLPLQGDANTSFLPWLVAPMVFLSALALAGSLTLHDLVSSWTRDASGTLTVEIPAPPGAEAEARARTQAEVAAAVTLMGTVPGVVSVRPLTQDQLAGLLAPWLGSSDVVKELPLPVLLDVTIDFDAKPNLGDVQTRLNQVAPGAVIDDHRVWLARLIGLSRSLERLGEGIVLLIAAATAATVVYATRTGLAVHRGTIEVMHLIGATDGYIAAQFASRAAMLAFGGGVVGSAAASGLLVFAQHWSNGLRGGFLDGLTMPSLAWPAILVIPFVAAGLALLTARLTVQGALVRLP